MIAIAQSYITSVGSPPTAPFWLCAFMLTGLVWSRRDAAAVPRSDERQRDVREEETAQRHRETRLDVMGRERDAVDEQKEGHGRTRSARTQGEHDTNGR